MFPQLKISEPEIERAIASASSANVARALEKNRRDFFDLLALISPTALTMLPQIRAAAAIERRRYFGRTVSIYAPLYVSNDCINSCRYCGFSAKNPHPRKTLTLAEVEREADAVRSFGINSLLIVASENPRIVGLNFLTEIGRTLRQKFSYLALEIAPQTEADYAELFRAGFDGLTLFQETYDRETYAELHPSGPKRDYDFRVESQLRAGRAKMRTLGLAFLLGLRNWRVEAASLAAHAFFLQRECWQSKLQFAFPRITALTPPPPNFPNVEPVNDDELELLMCAFRLVFPESGITVSTRESADLRDRLTVSCADNMSAGSRVTPGGYAVDATQETAQFTRHDEREVAEVVAAIRRRGQEAVCKNWDAAFLIQN